MRLDLKYARDWSIVLDPKILVKTPRAVFKSKRPFNDGRAGLQVVRMLQAANQSLEKNRQLGTSMKGKLIYM